MVLRLYYYVRTLEVFIYLVCNTLALKLITLL